MYFLFLIILLILIYFKYSLKNFNIKKHSTNEIAVGHYSDVVYNNFLLYPKLLFTSPIYFTINENESLWMPKYYWHWIKSSELTIAVNFWVPKLNNNDSKYEKPFKLSSNYQNNELICKNILSYKEKISFFDKSTTKLIEKNIQNLNLNENNYFYTVPKFNDNINEFENINSKFHNLNQEHIIIPDFLKNENNIKPNFWFATGNHETGLHYDDYDNLLCVLKGKKTIILYPPTDSIYLDPYPIIPFWANTKAIDFDSNEYKFYGFVENSLPSSRLLYELILCYNNKKMLSIITNLVKKIGINKLIYGCKLKDNIFRAEIYCYYKGTIDEELNNNLKNLYIYNEINDNFYTYKNNNDNIVIHSIDLYNNEEVIGDEIHFYHSSSNKLPYNGYSTTIKKDNVLNESIFILDDASKVKNLFDDYMKLIKYNNYNKNFIKLLNKYDCKKISLFNKFSNDIFIQYLNISITDFIKFIKEFKYPSQFIKHVEENKTNYEKIKHEITIVYDSNCNPVRSSFYGII